MDYTTLADFFRNCIMVTLTAYWALQLSGRPKKIMIHNAFNLREAAHSLKMAKIACVIVFVPSFVYTVVYDMLRNS